MDKKAKGRFRELNKLCQEYLQCEANKLEIPNETRVSGTYKMYLSALRSRRIIILYLTNSKDNQRFQDVVLSNFEWQFVAETEALLRASDILAMQTQKDAVNSNIFSYFYIAKTRGIIKRINQLQVFSLDKSWTPKTKVEDIDKVLIKKEDLMDETKTLMERLIVEFDKYFPQPDSDQLLMMSLHPIMVKLGFR
jgi:hypothetical protein